MVLLFSKNKTKLIKVWASSALLTLLIFSMEVKAQDQFFDTFYVYFKIGSSVLETEQKQRLDSLSAHLLAEKNRMLIYGYADYLGSRKPNYGLSAARASTVSRYLKSKGIEQEKILQTAAAGQIDERGDEAHGNQQYRSAAIFIRKNQSKEHLQAHSELQKNLIETPVGEAFELENIYFPRGKSRLTPEAIEVIQELLAWLKANPKVKIRLEGHVCCVEPWEDAYDEDFRDAFLSRNRARSIYSYLVRNGVSRSRLDFKGYGKSRPITHPDKTMEEQQKNRRVEVRIMER